MTFYILLALVIAFIAAFPLIRCFFKRILMVLTLRRVCKKRGFSLIFAYRCPFFGSKHGRACDFYIETEHDIYSVKLFGMPRRLSVLIFTDGGEYFVRNYLAFISYSTSHVHYPLDGKKRSFPDYDFRRSFRLEWETKTLHRILLVHPTAMEMRLQPEHGTEKVLGVGDSVNGCRLETLSRLVSKLESSR